MGSAAPSITCSCNCHWASAGAQAGSVQVTRSAWRAASPGATPTKLATTVPHPDSGASTHDAPPGVMVG